MSELPETLTPEFILGENGLLSSRMADYEVRNQQIIMANSIISAFLKKNHLIVEAGTGVGKSFGYLVPAILATSQDYLLPLNFSSDVIQKSRQVPLKPQKPYRRVIIATHTISLQEQLIEKDLPFLNSLLPLEFSFVLVKGRGNYLCWRRFLNAQRHAHSLFDSMEDMDQLQELLIWAKTTKDGTLSDMEFHPSPRVWEESCCEQGNCTGKRCEYYGDCFYQAARRRIHNAQILVVNHALFFSDLSVRSQGGSILPEYDAVVFDEAHTVEAVAGDHLGIQIANGQVEYLLRRLFNSRTGRGILAQYELHEAIKLIHSCYHASDEFFTEIQNWYEKNSRISSQEIRNPGFINLLRQDENDDDSSEDSEDSLSSDTPPFPRASSTINTPGISGNLTKKNAYSGSFRVRKPLEISNSLGFALSQLAGCIRNDAAALESAEERLELDTLADRLKNLAANLEIWLKQNAENCVYWIEYLPATHVRGKWRSAKFKLCASPIDVGPVLRENLYNEISSVIMTSATLATSGTSKKTNISPKTQKRNLFSEMNPPSEDTRPEKNIISEKNTPAGENISVGDIPQKTSSETSSEISSETSPETLSKTPSKTPAPILSETFLKTPSGTSLETALADLPDPAFDYFRHRIGLTQTQTELLGSPFDYEHQARIILPSRMPDPVSEAHEFERRLSERICRYVNMTDGHAFVLFTNYGLMNRIAANIAPWLTSQNLSLLSQGEGLSRSKMIERFKINPRAVLLGADSFWQGVDIPGNKLRNVIITKLPFRVPDHPLIEARLDAIKTRGGNPFMEFQVPDAIIRLKQGFGRLIRTKKDSGMVVIMDPRIDTKFYGKMFLKALPKCEIIRD
ncbi:MAG: helicase C-terminal domain-containing protein [Planctomycetia bacterium]|nr:helicase C-terminal domain-containing protein [Planctomycetia bacterium]